MKILVAASSSKMGHCVYLDVVRIGTQRVKSLLEAHFDLEAISIDADIGNQDSFLRQERYDLQKEPHQSSVSSSVRLSRFDQTRPSWIRLTTGIPKNWPTTPWTSNPSA